ncbi:hypothetical protein WN944_007948 [Citrus x changshan-huyou]|uniref:Uncharacterized protein n=1 Tax=Citrus x changshan-huyou TaxID=2935761 RepID=A0AAP0QYG8_9ROSI
MRRRNQKGRRKETEAAYAEMACASATQETGSSLKRSWGKKKSIYKIEFVNGMKLDWGAISSYLINEVDRTCKRPLLIVAKDVELEVGGSLFLDKTCLQTATPSAITWGPVPVRFENVWLEHHQFKQIFKNRWSEANCSRLQEFQGLEFMAFIEVLFLLARLERLFEVEEVRSAVDQCSAKKITRKFEGRDCEENLKGIMQDLAILTGGRVVVTMSSNCGVIPLMLGSCKEAIVRDSEMIIHGGSGAGVAFLHASKELDKLQTTEQLLWKPDARSLSCYEHINNNDLGFDPVRGEYVDVIKSGNIDPLKLVIKELDDLKSDLDNDSWCSSSEML